MKILLISTEIWSRNNPEGIVTRKLCKGLLKYYSVDIVTTNKTDLVGINKEYIVDDNGSEFIEKLKKISIGIEKNRFTQNVIKLIKDKVIDINDYDLLITRSEPFYIHNIGVFLKRNNYPIYWIASFGDPVFCNPYNSKSYIKKNYTKKTEKEIWHYADKITHTNSCALEVYEKNNFPIEKSYILPNTYEVSENEACNNFVYQDKKIDNFCYIGSLYGNRTPERLFDFLRKYDGNYKLTLIGAVRNVYWENRFGIFNKFLMARDLKKLKKTSRISI
ncbi:hypothetical protein PDY_07090 [Photobacterium damselae subsp. damselae]|uniref:hypothetical protein n=1 Tax=Photobacterium damselae TaxID=38293 RepID=UPI0022051D57|nr:hypothetical protein [Photobacterium damselae]BDR33661.1 hypothetical protein PDY_07090 [Photobacterium damselae subsp. damselae]